MRRTFREVVAHTAWMFGVWSSIRVGLDAYARGNPRIAESIWRNVTDVEIHSLQIRLGWDLAVLLLLAIIVVFVQLRRRRQIMVPVAGSLLLSAMLAVSMVYYPALSLSGRVNSPFIGVNRSLHESIAFAAIATAILAAITVGLAPTSEHTV
jgi:hypothetical protein